MPAKGWCMPGLENLEPKVSSKNTRNVWINFNVIMKLQKFGAIQYPNPTVT